MGEWIKFAETLLNGIENEKSEVFLRKEGKYLLVGIIEDSIKALIPYKPFEETLSEYISIQNEFSEKFSNASTIEEKYEILEEYLPIVVPYLLALRHLSKKERISLKYEIRYELDEDVKKYVEKLTKLPLIGREFKEILKKYEKPKYVDFFEEERNELKEMLNTITKHFEKTEKKNPETKKPIKQCVKEYGEKLGKCRKYLQKIKTCIKTPRRVFSEIKKKYKKYKLSKDLKKYQELLNNISHVYAPFVKEYKNRVAEKVTKYKEMLENL